MTENIDIMLRFVDGAWKYAKKTLGRFSGFPVRVNSGFEIPQVGYGYPVLQFLKWCKTVPTSSSYKHICVSPVPRCSGGGVGDFMFDVQVSSKST